MLLLTKIVHVLSLGLWFGTVVFFSLVVGLQLFRTFETISAQPAAERPLWLPVPAEYEKEPPGPRFPDPLRKEQGSRAAGAAVSSLFDWYFALQMVCAVLALASALTWWSAGTVHTLRIGVLLLALTTVAGGWLLERVVSGLRDQRSETTDRVLRSPAPDPASIEAAEQARAEFGRWHTYSLMVNFATLLLVTVAMAMAAQLPASAPSPQRAPLEAGTAVPT
jgi:hypothetical protein